MKKNVGSGWEVLSGVAVFCSVFPLLLAQTEVLGETGMPPGVFLPMVLLVSSLGTLLVSLAMDLPLVVFPQFSLVAFFSFFLCGELQLPWKVALGVFLLGSAVAFLTSLFPGWNRAFCSFPTSLRLALSGSLGLLLFLRGLLEGRIILLRETGGLGLGDFTHPRVWAVLLGFLVVVVAYGVRLRGALLLGVLTTAVFSWWKGLLSFEVQGGPLSLFPSSLFLQADIPRALQYGTTGLIGVVAVLVFFETFGVLGGCLMRLGVLEGQENFARFSKGLLFGTLGAVLGTLFGIPGVLPAHESAIGLGEREKRSLAGVVCGGCFFISLLFLRYLPRVPSFLAAPALLAGGFFMAEPLGRIDFQDISEGIPALLTLVVTLGTFSLLGGIAFGVLSYTLLNLILRKGRQLYPIMYILSFVFLWWLFVQ